MDFVLVHGGYHGAWCWERLIPALERRGHRATAMDLPISDPAAGAAEYATTIREAMEGRDDVVLVGHSMGGLSIPVAAAEGGVSRMVFLCAFVPRPGVSMNEIRKTEPVETYELQTMEFTDLGDQVWEIGSNTATELFYHDASPEDAAWAIERLRPQCYRVLAEVTPLQAWPGVPSTVIVCGDDHAADPDWQRSVARDRFGVEAIELDGGHSPFLTRPVELAAVLSDLADS